MKKIKHTLFIFLILINLITLYLVIDLSYYDELTAYLKTGDIKYSSPKTTAWIIFVVLVFNLFFMCVAFMKEIMFRTKKTKTL